MLPPEFSPDFGTDIWNNHETSEVANLVQNYGTWIPILRQRFANIQSRWVAVDPGEATKFNGDLTALEARWAAAAKDAAANMQSGGWITNLSAEAAYNKYLKAVRQGAPPISAAVRSGDYSDLLERVGDAEGALNVVPAPGLVNPSVQQPPLDSSLALYKTLSKVDVIGHALGDLKGPGPLGAAEDWSHYAKLATAGLVAGLATYIVVEAMKTYRVAKGST